MAKAAKQQFALGVDYGTASCRALIVRTADGKEVASASYAYKHGDDGVLTDAKDPNLARQSPTDYTRGFETVVAKAIKAAKDVKGFDPNRIVGIGIDGTGSTPIPVDGNARPLGATAKWKHDLDAQAWLWKDHTAWEQAEEITAKADDDRTGYLSKCGGTYSSEWYWSKLLRCQRTNAKVFDAAASWVELTDWVPAWLTGVERVADVARSICPAGHKAMYHEQWGGWPGKGFLASLSPGIAALRDRLPPNATPLGQTIGTVAPSIAKKVGLPEGVPVATGLMDAHAGAVGAGIKPGTLVKIIGTSTCDMMVAPLSNELADIPGLCGIVPGSILPDHYGLEAGQSAVGDIFNWFVNHLTPPEYRKGRKSPHEQLTAEADKLKPGESGLLALDWNNGNRTVLVDPRLTGLLIGQTLHTTAAEIYRALIEATAFGALTIIKRFEAYGVKVREVVNCGGIAEKNPLLMQIYADVTNRPMKTSRSAQTCALGAAIYGAVVGGAYRKVEEAQKHMTGTRDKVYRPHKPAVETYARLYRLYSELHETFGTQNHRGELYRTMKDLIDLRREVRG